MSESCKGVLLLVDGDAMECSRLRHDLGTTGYQVLEAADEAAAAVHLASCRVSAVIVGLAEPQTLNTIDLVKAHSPAAKIIVMSASAAPESIVAAMKRGASEYLVKPVATDALLCKLSGCCASGNGEAGHNGDVLQSVTRTNEGIEGMMGGLTETVAGIERSLIDAALKRAAGNQAKAAQFLRIPRTTLRDKMAKYGMVGEAAKRQPIP
jgi:DNA-binding NtrC family response regulator